MRPLFLLLALILPHNDRDYWTDIVCKLAEPVLTNMAEGKLQQNMEVELSPIWDNRDVRVTYMECFGRLMTGIAPWLALPDDDTPESARRAELRRLALKAYRNAVDPESPDYLLWRKEGQPLVDAAFIAESFIRAYDALWMPLDDLTKQRYIEEFTLLRRVDPPYSNWLLFGSTIEAFLFKAAACGDAYRVSSTVRKIEEWYVGDGWYSDGPDFAFNYYNSYVIHPMFLETLQTMIDAKAGSFRSYQRNYDRALVRTQRLSVILERFISPEGTFPVFGRSSTYRLAAMQPLALIAWYDKLPEELSYGQVRSALNAVIHKMFDHQENFNSKGFLTLGFCGSQPGISDSYTNNGSLYMTSMIFLPLGLPADHPFWTSPAEPWTQCKAWGGQQFPKDQVWRDSF